jgi:SHS2 domain-containing protein
MQQGHVSFEHTADLGIEAWSESFQGLLEEVSLGLCELIADLSTIRADEARSVEADGVDREELLVSLSNEVLFYLDAQGFLSKQLIINELYQDGELWQVKGKLYGEPYDSSRHVTFTEIKSATYHDLHVDESPEGLRVKIVFDV